MPQKYTPKNNGEKGVQIRAYIFLFSNSYMEKKKKNFFYPDAP